MVMAALSAQFSALSTSPRRNRHLFSVPPPSLLQKHLIPNQLSLSSSSSSLLRWSIKCSSQQQSAEELELERLFSNLNQATLKREPGSLSSAVFLVAGTSVGAGILAIPAVTQESGFLASAVTCIVCWAFMVTTGLLMAEVNVNTMFELGSGGVSLVSMAMRTLGKIGVQIACWSYILIHYAVLVAYVARSSDILTTSLGIPLWESAAVFSVVIGSICYFGSQRFIGTVNGVLVSGIIVSFDVLVAVSSADLHWDALLRANFEAVPMSIPVIALSFVYQNVVPVVCTNLEGDLSKMFGQSKKLLAIFFFTWTVSGTAIVLGTAIPLVLFLVWNAVILGTITDIGTNPNNMIDPLQQLRSSNGFVGPIVEVFSLLAIATSYIGFVLGLTDFVADLLKLPPGKSRPVPYLITLVPPLMLSLLNPDIFFKALDFAGTYGVLLLFGILPAAMSWSDRYSSSSSSMKQRLPEMVPGGRFTLALVMGGSAFVILSELLENLART